ncbi:MAG: DUF5320 domain-containing protein [Dehalococcoidales bacterium]|nr:DUF5320 domain-containing protein [Dehalococcoidales bacterium]
MPSGDRTGPAGMGPMTGRGAGYCTGYTWPGFLSRIPGRRWFGIGRRNRGNGRGFRNNWYRHSFRSPVPW